MPLLTTDHYSPMHLSSAAARSLLLATQGLLTPPKRKATKADLLKTIRTMGVLQIDTIHVVARSPYLVLWSRLGLYEPSWLDELLSEGAIFEYWSHEACFLPIEDYPLYRSRMLAPGSRAWRYSHEWMEKNTPVVDRVLSRIRDGGTARSADFKREDGKKGGWWEWKPEKRALEMLFTAGELMVARRHNFHRIYDLRVRIMPSWDDARTPSIETVRRELVLRSIRALGITTERWVADYYRMRQGESRPLVEALADSGELLRATVEGWNSPAYIHPDNLALAKKAATGKLEPSLTTLLSPFDPLVWDRTRALEMFDFDYKLECYVPEEKRRYGYFTLPVLRRGEIVGRLEAKAHRGDGIFEVKRLHMEPRTKLTDEMASDIASALLQCAAWHKTPEVVIRWSEPRGVARTIQRAIGG